MRKKERYHFAISEQTITAVGRNGRAEVWNFLSGKLTTSFKIAQGINLVKQSSSFIVCAQEQPRILHIHKNDDVCGVSGSVDLKKYFRQQGRNSSDPYIKYITIINSNLVMVVSYLGIVFVSLP